MREKIEKIVKRITYKPGWRIYCASRPREPEVPEGELVVRIIFMAEDVTAPGKQTKVGLGVSFWLDQDYSEEVILKRIMQGVRELEMHEVEEWFKVDGRNFVDPHPELNKEWHEVKGDLSV